MQVNQHLSHSELLAYAQAGIIRHEEVRAALDLSQESQECQADGCKTEAVSINASEGEHKTKHCNATPGLDKIEYYLHEATKSYVSRPNNAELDGVDGNIINTLRAIIDHLKTR